LYNVVNNIAFTSFVVPAIYASYCEELLVDNYLLTAKFFS